MRLGRPYRRRRQPLDSVAFFKRSVLVFGILLLIALLVAAPIWALWPLEVEEATVSITDMPSQLKNLKIAFASDFHYSAGQTSLSLRAVKKLNELGADIVILGGDYGDTPEDSIAFFESMPAFTARVGVFAVLGDTDRDTEHLQLLLATMKSKGITPLMNGVEAVKIGGQYLYVAGLDDAVNGSPDTSAILERVTSQDTVILVAHNPCVLSDLQESQSSRHWFDLGLFGHTHGGQIRIGSWSPFESLVEDVPERYLGGWVEENRASLLISNGVGYEGLPLRLLATPQVHLITLKVR